VFRGRLLVSGLHATIIKCSSARQKIPPTFPGDRKQQLLLETYYMLKMFTSKLHKLGTEDAWINGYVEKCRENYGPLLIYFDGSAAVPLSTHR
jgi:hypothetical protein